MKYKIYQIEYESIEKIIKQEMRQATKDAIGYDEWEGEMVCFEANHGNEFLGAIVMEIILGQMCIHYVVVKEKYRNKGIGTQLLQKAFELAKVRGCTFAYLETLNYQAPKFYEKHGFKLEFSRGGYNHGVTFNYYKKIFKFS